MQWPHLPLPKTNTPWKCWKLKNMIEKWNVGLRSACSSRDKVESYVTPDRVHSLAIMLSQYTQLNSFTWAQGLSILVRGKQWLGLLPPPPPWIHLYHAHSTHTCVCWRIFTPSYLPHHIYPHHIYPIIILKLFLSTRALKFTYTCDLVDYEDRSEPGMRVRQGWGWARDEQGRIQGGGGLRLYLLSIFTIYDLSHMILLRPYMWWKLMVKSSQPHPLYPPLLMRDEGEPEMRWVISHELYPPKK